MGNVPRATDHGSTDLPTAPLVAAVEAAVAWRPSSWNAATRQGVLADLDRTIASLETVRSAVLFAEQEAGTWRGSGDPSLAAWRARITGAGKRAASAQVRRAEGLAAVPTTAEAVTGGDIGWEHAGVIARLASTGTEAQQAVVTSAEGQRTLVGMARRLDADTFATAAAVRRRARPAVLGARPPGTASSTVPAPDQRAVRDPGQGTVGQHGRAPAPPGPRSGHLAPRGG